MIATLYDTFKHWSESGSVYLISDPHFLDKDTLLMNENWIPADEHLNRINAKVHKNDTLICLGDCGNLSYFRKIKAGKKILIKGNHDDKGNSVYKRKTIFENIDKIASRQDVLNEYKEKYPDFNVFVYDGIKFSMPDKWVIEIDNALFDEVYEGPLFIADKILLSHEPVFGLPFCINIHGHCHNGVKEYIDEFSCSHINLASDVTGWQVDDLGLMIKNGLLSKINSIHRITIDNAIIRKAERSDE